MDFLADFLESRKLDVGVSIYLIDSLNNVLFEQHISKKCLCLKNILFKLMFIKYQCTRSSRDIDYENLALSFHTQNPH